MDEHIDTSSTERQRRGVLRHPGQVPNYKLIRVVGAGSFGEVWLAREKVTGVRRAVKVIYKDDLARAEREIEGVRRYQQAALRHPSLLQILSVGETRRCYYCVMETADAVCDDRTEAYEPLTLRRRLQSTEVYDARTAMRFVGQVGEGLAELHRQELGHHDVKPENILIVNGEPKLADVGLVGGRLSGSDGAGTPGYLSPTGAPSDVYALGKVLYEMISGRPASEFPSLPVEMLDSPVYETACAIAIVNRACHPRGGKGFESIDELLAAIKAALRPVGPFGRYWRQLSRRGKYAVASWGAVLAISLAFLVHQIHLRLVPQAVERRAVEFAALVNRDSHCGEEASLYGEPMTSYVQVGEQILAPDCLYQLTLGQRVRWFSLDFRLRSQRPWGQLRIGVADEPEGRQEVAALFQGQPDGEGLIFGAQSIGADGTPRSFDTPDFGHPQPGLDYVLRITRERDDVCVALWPVTGHAVDPVVKKIVPPSAGFAAAYIRISGAAGDPRAHMDILGAELTRYSAPLDNALSWQADLALAALHPALPPPLAGDTWPTGDLLADPFHPYSSDAWNAIGPWAWWSGAHPGNGPKAIRCVPFSTQKRGELRDHRVYRGLQMLRFDRAEYEDFVAAVRVRLADPLQPGARPYDPFVSDSHSGSFGLAFRMQDEAPDGCLWGGAYLAKITIEPDPSGPAIMSLVRHSGMNLDSHLAVEPAASRMLATADISMMRNALFAPNGIVLSVQANGRHLTVGLDGQAVLEVVDESADAFAKGRIALVADRFIASFAELFVTPAGVNR